MPPKKAAKLHAENRHEAKDLRRAYEHMGRVEILQRSLKPAPAEEVSVLAALARQELQSGHIKEAAELLRAAEHLNFAAPASENARSSQLAKDLGSAVTDEFECLVRKAEEHWEHGGERQEALIAIYKNSLQKASQALKRGDYYRALEFARTADALADVKQHGPHRIADGVERLKLSAS